MSYGSPKPTNPATKFIDFKGEKGIFQYYVKPEDEKEKGVNVIIPLPLKLIVVDEYSTITGFSDEMKCGIYSNEIKNIKKEVLSVRTFKGGKGWIGTYDEIKGNLKGFGGRFAKSVYAVIVLDGKPELVNFKVAGSFLNAWIDSKIDTYVYGILISGTEHKKKGSNDYEQPILETFIPDNPAKAKQLVISFKKQLDEYFKLKKQGTDEEVTAEQEVKENETNEHFTPDEDDEGLPF